MLAGETQQRRRVGSVAAAAAIAIGLVVAATAVAPAAAKALPRQFFGVTAVSAEPSDFTRMGRGRVGTLRILLSWPAVQPTADGAYDWSASDAKVAGAAVNGIEPFPVLYGSSPFVAGPTEVPPLGSAEARRRWKDFVAAAVRRYGPGGEFWDLNPGVPYRPMRAWKVWNEQNAAHFWKPKPSPSKYAKLLRLTSKAVKRVDPEAEIVLGGMFGYPGGRGSIGMGDYLKRLYRVRSARRHFDAVGLHPYGGTLRLMRYQIKQARRIMNRNGDKEARIWITEISWTTDGPPNWPLVTSERGQARKLKGAFRMIVRNRRGWGVKRVIWFAWRDFRDKVCRWCGGAGLIRLNGNPKPAWKAFRRFSAKTR